MLAQCQFDSAKEKRNISIKHSDARELFWIITYIYQSNTVRRKEKRRERKSMSISVDSKDFNKLVVHYFDGA